MTPFPMRLMFPAVVSLYLCAAGDAAAARDRTAHVDSVREQSGAMLYRVRCTDITVRLRNGAWTPADSLTFFAEYLKVQQASTALKSQVDHLRASLAALTDSAGAYLADGRYTRTSLDSAISRTQSSLEKTVNTHTYSLRRLEEYVTVLNAVRPILHASSPR